MARARESDGTLDLRAWIGRERTEADVITLAPARGMAALLDRDADGISEGTRLPEAWHWIYFKPLTRQSELGDDGHAVRGGFLPPVPLPRRMWAGGRLRFGEPLLIGDAVERRSEIMAVEAKEGRSGKLVFVTVRHRVSGPRGLAVDEEQDLVYREAPVAGVAPRSSEQVGSGQVPRRGEPLPGGLEWREQVVPDAVVLFRFSALTFNGHRVHYDHPYATEVEGYRGLLVHAPLTALLLLDAASRHAGARPAAYAYRGTAPLFGGERVTLAGRAREGGAETEAWAAGPTDTIAMRANVEWKDD